ncbi:oligosaccharide repeat unit polymerase [Vibrio sp. YYF0003]|uniref:oligosaccharide repeat unit polymerase n=1 Tax=Vibrio sp. YYF0003 TaxID=3116646 RepID=UPI002E9EE54F|nr:oligosaccharide repeat unit polymerase [Vibrio sp. YYF0003]
MLNIKHIPRSMILWLYSLSNILFCFVYFFSGSLGSDYDGYIVYFPYTLLYCLVLVLSSFFILHAVFKFFEKINMAKSYKVSTDSTVIHYFIFIILSIAFTFSIVYGYGRVGNENSLAPSFVSLFNKFLVPQYLLYCYIAIFYDSKRIIYFVNLLVFVLFNFYKGYTFIILVIGFLWVFRILSSGKSISWKMIFLLVFLLLISPLVRLLKNVVLYSIGSDDASMAESMQIIISNRNGDSNFSLYIDFLLRTFERFESVSATYYIVDNKDILSTMYEDHNFLPFYLYHWIPQTLEKILSYNSIYDITQVYAQRYIAGFYNPYYVWQTHIGYFGWPIINPEGMIFYYLYSVALMFLLVFISQHFTSNKGLLEMSWILTILYMGHGWFNDYIIFIQALVVMYVLLLFVGFFKRFSNE